MTQPRKPGRPKAKDRRGANLKEATVLIPLSFNDETAVSHDVIRSILDELYEAFQGWTIEGTVKGAYRMQSGQKRVEDLLKVSVVLDESQIPELEARIAGWAAQLGQELMLLKIADFIVKFVPPRQEAEEP